MVAFNSDSVFPNLSNNNQLLGLENNPDGHEATFCLSFSFKNKNTPPMYFTKTVDNITVKQQKLDCS